MNRRDYIAMTTITLIYATVALCQLGSTVAPQSFWKPGTKGESAIGDFGQAQQIESILWFGGIRNGSFQVESSEDGQAWFPVTTADLNDSSVFQWRKVQAAFTARYVRVVAIQPGASLGEMGFQGTDRKLVSLAGESNPSAAFDEQGAVPQRPSYRNSMYFDEIYHARTAYESLHHMEPYETTHPPLGKILISAGVAMLGMNPFGWRIAGVLFGIAIVPLVYLFARRLFKETRYAALASFLIAFDFMLFTQSRLATVDTFAVFFILLTYERMLSSGLFFIGVPLIIYGASYIPFMLVPGPGHGWKDVIGYQKFMYDYHSRLKATHPFSSTWWEWPLIRKPIWYYGGTELAQGKMASIVAMGNPAVWWAGTIAAVATFRSALKNRDDTGMVVVVIGIIAAYVPWILVSRLTFIYHFFACVPFLILCIVYWVRKLEEGKPHVRKWTHLYAGAVLLLFILFYPILSGTEIYVSYSDGMLKWFNGWIFHG